MKKSTVLNHARKKLDPVSFRIFEFLVERLQNEQLPVNYEPIGLHVGLPHQHDSLGPYLAAATVYTHEQHGFLISAMVHVSGKQEPGNGFAVFAWEQLSIRINTPLWYQDELNKMIAWAKKLT